MFWTTFDSKYFIVLFVCFGLNFEVSKGFQHPECGIRSTKFEDARSKRVIGGIYSKEGEWPWVVSINSNDPGMKKAFPQSTWHACTGSLINEEWVLTASHCVSYHRDYDGFRDDNRKDLDAYYTGTVVDKSSITVTVGTHDLENMGEKYDVIELIIYPTGSTSANYMKGDLALLKLEKKVKFSDKAKPICLSDRDIQNGELCHYAGWGLTAMTYGPDEHRSKILKQIKVKVIDFESCYESIKDTLDSDFIKLIQRNTSFCGSYMPKKDGVWFGDAGGPLMCYRENRWYQAGITWVAANCLGCAPDIYLDVRVFKSWIDTVTYASTVKYRSDIVRKKVVRGIGYDIVRSSGTTHATTSVMMYLTILTLASFWIWDCMIQFA